jgi:hypothetical protein
MKLESKAGRRVPGSTLRRRGNGGWKAVCAGDFFAGLRTHHAMKGILTTSLLLLALSLHAMANEDDASDPSDRAESATVHSTGFDPEPPAEFLSRVEEIADWIVVNSDYGGYERLPAFVKLPRATLNYVVFSRLPEAYHDQDCINAIYLPHVVLLADDFLLEDSEYTLVHELVHHFQFESGISFRRPADAELEAYELQIKWVLETGEGEIPCTLFMQRLRRVSPHD